MTTNQVMGAMLGAALLSGVAFAQTDGLQGSGDGDGAESRPGCRCGGEGAGPMMGGFGNRGGMGGPQMGCPQMGCPQMKARCEFGRGGRGPARLPDPKALKEAGATDQQIESLKKFEDERQLKQIDLKAAVEKAELSFGQLMQTETVDEAAALKAAETVSQTRAEAFKAEISAQLKVRAILGADVLKKLRETRPAAVQNRVRCGRQDESCPCMGGQQNVPGQAGVPRGQPPAGERPQLKE